MRAHLHPQEQIAGRTAVRAAATLTREPDPLSFAYAGRDLHREPAGAAVLIGDLERTLRALERVRQRDLDLGLEIRADRGRVARSAGARGAKEIVGREATASVAEQRAEEIGEVAEILAGERPSATGLARVRPLEPATAGTAGVRVAREIGTDGVVSLKYPNTPS